MLKKYSIPCFALILLFVFLAIGAASGASINAKSCSREDVQAAINSASVGDSVLVAPGNCSWGSGVGMSGKRILLRGAGIGSTIINAGGITAVNIGTSGSRVTGIEFNFKDASGIAIAVGHDDWRVDNCEFDYRTSGSKGTAIEYENRNRYYPPYVSGGLVDNCYFYNSRIYINGSSYNRSSSAYRYHSVPVKLGSGQAVYVEDNHFSLDKFGNLIDGNRSGEFVFRFNTVVKTGNGGSVIEAHSFQSDLERGTKKWEIYHNHITHGQWVTMFLRGGTGVIFNNDIMSSEKVIRFDNVRDTKSIGVAGLCDGTSNWDLNASSGRLCRDQVGSAEDLAAWNGSLPLPAQRRAPAYIWGNTAGTSISEAGNVRNSRDYYSDISGMISVGPLNNRPVSCTTNQAYWATDQGSWDKSNKGGAGVLYKCIQENTWAEYYTPYEYPHPLRSYSDLSPIKKVDGLRIVQ